MADPKVTQQEAFREGITDALALIDRLSAYCNTIDELKGILSHAQENDAQLRLLFTTLTRK